MSKCFLPFLYQTRTLQRPRWLTRPLTVGATRRQSRNDPIPFEIPSDLRNDLEPPPPSPSTPRGTITPTEREAFERIFEEIAARRPATAFSPVVDATSAAAQESNAREAVERQPASRLPTSGKVANARHSVDIIMAAAERTSRHGAGAALAYDELHPLEAVSSTSDSAKALLRFPPSLRRAARLALGVIEHDQNAPNTVVSLGESGPGADRVSAPAVGAQGRFGTLPPARPTAGNRDGLLDEDARSVTSIASQVELEARRGELRLGIEEKMRAARSDFALWDVMERDVFPLVDRLGIGDRPERAPKKSRRETRGGSRALDMHVYGPCYPSLLLYGLRLLDTHFTTSSPLALSVLPRVKELGLTSYVLGASTPFYTSLMSIYWKQYGDVTSVLSLLEEMRHAGLYFDDATRDLVRRMRFHFDDTEAGRKGPVLQALMALPEFEDVLSTRLRHWIRQVDASIGERQRDVGY